MSNFFSQIIPVHLHSKRYQSFYINPKIDRNIGNRIAWRLSDRKIGRVVIFYANTGTFWSLEKAENKLLSQTDWQSVLNSALEHLEDEIGNSAYRIEELENTPPIPAPVIAQVAAQVLNFSNSISSEILYSVNNINVETDINFWSEVFEFNRQACPAIGIGLKTRMVYKEDLRSFLKLYSHHDNLEEQLEGLLVKPIDSNGKGTIVRVAGIVRDRRDELLSKTSSSIIEKKLRIADDTDLIFSIKFGKKNRSYDYPCNALKPLVTPQNSYLFNVKFGDLQAYTKLGYQKRLRLLDTLIEQIMEIFFEYCLLTTSFLSSEQYSSLLISPKFKLEETKILFGQSITSIKQKSLSGLRSGGVFYRHPKFTKINKIRLGVLKPKHMMIGSFRKALQDQLTSYKFDSILADECCVNYDITDLNGSESRAKLEESLNLIYNKAIDLVIVFLPGSQEDEDEDAENDTDLYQFVKRQLLRQDIASQVVYENTIIGMNNYANVLNNIVPGILGKLGNLPFVLAEPLSIAESFVGLDVGRSSYENRSGSRNVCASIRLYGQRGEFFKYRLDDSLIEGEEIPRRVLEDFLPLEEFKNKKVLIYRDGRFRGDEVKHLLARAQAINARFILVESVKSQIPRLYSFQNGQLGQPLRGLALKLSEREAILVTTSVPVKVGVPRPIRLRIHEQGEQASLEDLIEATLKLTLLHYGSLKDPRLPIPLYASDLIAYRRLQGIYPTRPEGDRQFWL